MSRSSDVLCAYLSLVAHRAPLQQKAQARERPLSDARASGGKARVVSRSGFFGALRRRERVQQGTQRRKPNEALFSAVPVEGTSGDVPICAPIHARQLFIARLGQGAQKGIQRVVDSPAAAQHAEEAVI